MTFTQSLLSYLTDDGRLEGLSIADIEALLNLSFPPERRAPLASRPPVAIEPPPIDLPDIRWGDGAFHAMNTADVQAIVRAALGQQLTVRAAGSRHSTTEAVYSPRPKDLRVILDGELRRIDVISTDGTDAVVSVGGGCYLGVNPSDPSSTPQNSLTRFLDNLGYALPVLGGISHQTVSGFLQTSSAGGSLAHGFADAVEEIELVDGSGNLRVFQRGSDEFAAAGVAVGLFGIITRVVLRAGRRFFVAGTETNHKEKDSFLRHSAPGVYELSDALQRTEYLHLNWFPQKHVRRVTQWVGSRSHVSPQPDPYDSELKSLLITVLAAVVLEITSGIIHIDPNGELAQRLVGALLKAFVPLNKLERFDDAWYKVLPCDDQVRVDSLIKIIFTEIWLPLDQLTETLDRLVVLLKDQSAAGNFAVELYGAKQSPFWLSPSYGRDVVRVDVFWWAYSFGDPRKHFTLFWEALLDIPGARLHWGKHLPDVGTTYGNVVFGPQFLRHAYDRMDDWATLRKKMDPNGVFVTDYWRRILPL